MSIMNFNQTLQVYSYFTLTILYVYTVVGNGKLRFPVQIPACDRTQIPAAQLHAASRVTCIDVLYKYMII